MEPITITIAGIKIVGFAALKIKLLILFWKTKGLLSAAGISTKTFSITALAAMCAAALEGASTGEIIKKGMIAGASESVARFFVFNVLRR